MLTYRLCGRCSQHIGCIILYTIYTVSVFPMATRFVRKKVARNRFEAGIIAISLYLVSTAISNAFGNVSAAHACTKWWQFVKPHGQGEPSKR